MEYWEAKENRAKSRKRKMDDKRSMFSKFERKENKGVAKMIKRNIYNEF